MSISRTLLLVVSCALLGEDPPSENGSSPAIEFSIMARSTQYVAGTPILVKVEIHNAGVNTCKTLGGVGWGRKLLIFTRHEGGVEKVISPDVLQMGTSYIPAHVFTFDLPAGGTQSIVHIIQTKTMFQGRLSLRALIFQHREPLWTPEVTVKLLDEKNNGKKHGLLSPEEESVVYDYIPRRHNRFDRHLNISRGPRSLHPKLVSIVKKAVVSNDVSIACEYALYAGVLLAIDAKATADDIKLAEEAAEAFAKRFPDSWLRAYAYAMLSTVHFERGNSEKARAFAQQGLKLPESNPLFHNLGIMDSLEKLKAASERQQGKSSQETDIR